MLHFAALGASNAEAAILPNSTLNISGALQLDGSDFFSTDVLISDPGSTLPGTGGSPTSDNTCAVGEACDVFVTTLNTIFLLNLVRSAN